MLFPLKNNVRGINKINEVPLVFLENAVNAYQCTKEIFPSWFREIYQVSPGLRARFEAVFFDFKKLSKAKKRYIINIYRQSRNIQEICNNPSVLLLGIEKIDEKIQKSLKELFVYLYEQTISTKTFRKCAGGSIDDHYSSFFDEHEVHVCPFCGLETYSLPEHRRADYDHYLPISIYPWLSVNFNNLVPMGHICNAYKNDANILYTDYVSKNRRRVWYPYEWFEYSITAKCLIKPSITNPLGTWSVDIKGGSAIEDEKISTWKKVFNIENQFNLTLKKFHKRFIEDLVKKNDLYGARLTPNKLREELRKYRNGGIGDPRIETMSKLKSVWAEYYITTTDTSELSVVIYTISITRKRYKP